MIDRFQKTKVRLGEAAEISRRGDCSYQIECLDPPSLISARQAGRGG